MVLLISTLRCRWRGQGTTAPLIPPLGCLSGPGLAPDDTTHQSVVTPCPVGSYCSNGVAMLCPAGRFGAVPQMPSLQCSGGCAVGFYCPANSTSPTQVPCGNVSVYCPAGSGGPTVALPGQWTQDKLGVGIGLGDAPTNGTTTMASAVPCPSGSYCLGGVATPCSAGRFGCALVSTTVRVRVLCAMSC